MAFGSGCAGPPVRSRGPGARCLRLSRGPRGSAVRPRAGLAGCRCRARGRGARAGGCCALLDEPHLGEGVLGALVRTALAHPGSPERLLGARRHSPGACRGPCGTAWPRFERIDAFAPGRSAQRTVELRSPSVNVDCGFDRCRLRATRKPRRARPDGRDGSALRPAVLRTARTTVRSPEPRPPALVAGHGGASRRRLVAPPAPDRSTAASTSGESRLTHRSVTRPAGTAPSGAGG